jgi:hypothetical protein
MKVASVVVGVLGVLVIALAVIGRFRGVATVTIMSNTFTASAVLLAGIALLVGGVWLAVLALPDRK